STPGSAHPRTIRAAFCAPTRSRARRTASTGRTSPASAMPRRTTSSTRSRSSSTATVALLSGIGLKRSMPKNFRHCRFSSEPTPMCCRNGCTEWCRPVTNTRRRCGSRIGASSAERRVPDMARFVLLRLLQTLLVLAIMSFVIYGLIGLMPGDPINLMLAADPHLTSADVARLKALYGLDQPLLKRYIAWAGAALSGNFGYSRLYATTAIAALAPRLANTALLMGLSFVLSLALALPLGALAARRPGSALDLCANLLSFAGISVPPFWLALMLILVFAVALGWLPPGGIATIGDGGILDRARHLVLQVRVLTLASIGTYL